MLPAYFNLVKVLNQLLAKTTGSGYSRYGRKILANFIN
jgi:hypothetical protein